MIIEFVKYQGTGNDFILIDNRSISFPKDHTTLIQCLCDRRFGIGADGLMLIEHHEQLDFSMIYFNSDGSKSLCGNGSRCAIHFANSLGMISKNTTIFETTDGIHNGGIKGDEVTFQLHDIEKITTKEQDYFINNGSPHHISFVSDVDQIDVCQEGRKIRFSDAYHPFGTNVNFVEQLGPDSIRVRTYERGVENETLSCGTGVTAAAMASFRKNIQLPMSVETKGGNLSVTFEYDETGAYKNILLTGPAKKVFEGEIDTNSLGITLSH